MSPVSRGNDFSEARSSSRQTLRKVRDLKTPKSIDGDVVITLNGTVQYQSVLGFGSSFTDAAGYVLSLLSNGAKTNFFRSYFDTNGKQDVL